MDERPLTMAFQVEASAKSSGSIQSRCAANMPSTARPAGEIDARDALRAVQPVPRDAEYRVLALRSLDAPAALSSCRRQPHQERLLRVEAVLGLVPHDALRAVDHLSLDLVAAVGGQAVDEDRVGPSRAT